MIEVEGYKAFKGIMKIIPVCKLLPFLLEGDFLYKPDTKCWYHKGSSYPEEICKIMEDKTNG